jgi:hypothetical protein
MMQKIHNLLLLSILAVVPAISADSLCDPGLEPVKNSATAYKQRDARCEGFYRSEVSAANLAMVSLLASRFDYDVEDHSKLRVNSPLMPDKAIHLRAIGIPLKTYYRLDAELAPGATLDWPLEVLQRQGIRLSKVGIYGWVPGDPALYVPLVVSPDGSGEQIQPVLRVRPSIDVAKILWRVSELVDGRCAPPGAWQRIEAPSGIHSGRAAAIELPQSSSGALCIWVSAKPKGTGDWLPTMDWRIHVGS